MGFSFLAEDEAQSNKKKEAYAKAHPSFFDKLEQLPFTATRAVARPVIDLATGQGGKLVHDTAQLGSDATGGIANYLLDAAIANPVKEEAARLTGNKEAEKNAIESSDVNLGLGKGGEDLRSGLAKLALNGGFALASTPTGAAAINTVVRGGYGAAKDALLGGAVESTAPRVTNIPVKDLTPESETLLKKTQKLLPAGRPEPTTGEGFVMPDTTQQGMSKIAANRLKSIDNAIADAQKNGTNISASGLRELMRERESLLKVAAGEKTLAQHDLESAIVPTPSHANGTPLSEATNHGPGAQSVYENLPQEEKMRQALLGVDDNTATLEQKLSADGNPVEPKTGAQLANENIQATTGEALPEDVVNLLEKTGNAKDTAVNAPILNGARDPASVAAHYYGDKGANIVYDLQRGAKTRSDLMDTADPLIKDAQDALNKSATTEVGRRDVEYRIDQALNDRAHASKYLNTDAEKKAFESAAKFYDFWKGQLEKAGKPVRENYAPQQAIKDAATASDKLDYGVQHAFSDNVNAPYLKPRTKEMEALAKTPITAMRHYNSAVSKQLAYEDVMSGLKDKLASTNPLYSLDSASRSEGQKYMQGLIRDALQPDVASHGTGAGKLISERTQNKLLAQTYHAALAFSPKFWAQNATQRWLANSQVSKEALQLSKGVDNATWKDLEKEITSGQNPITGDIEISAGSVGTRKGYLSKYDLGTKVEQKNVTSAFRKGVSQQVLESGEYKAAVQNGASSQDAFEQALQNPDVRQLAVRRGNVVVNTTQLGGNIMNKPGWLRESGTVLGISKKWYQQYQRFPLGMMQILGSNVGDPNMARALDIMRRGNPLETPVVDYWKAVRTLKNAMPEALKAAKKGEIDMSPEELQKSADLLNKMDKIAKEELKKRSQIRAGKTAGSFGRMWAAASAIQFLFSGGNGGVTQALKYGAPVNIPTKNENPLNPVPNSIPVNSEGQVNQQKLLNFIPIVGPVTNRAGQFQRATSALTGDNSQ